MTTIGYFHGPHNIAEMSLKVHALKIHHWKTNRINLGIRGEWCGVSIELYLTTIYVNDDEANVSDLKRFRFHL